MSSRRWLKVPIVLLGAVAALSLVMDQGIGLAAPGGKTVTQDQVFKKFNRVTPAEQKAAAKRTQELGMLPGVAGMAVAPTAPLPGLEGPGGVPHYFGPYGNWAFSPLPTGGVATLTLIDGGTGYTSPVVTIGDAFGTGSGATATATVVGGVVTGLTITNPGTGYSAPVASIDDTMPGPGAGAAATITLTASVAAITVDIGGSGYTAPIVTISDAFGTGASAAATIDPATGTITAITVLAGGSGYVAPTVTITDPDPAAAGAAATPTLSASVAAITVDAGGSGYGAPTVTISDLTGVGAAATATVVGGVITAITVDAAGSGYTAPTLTITDSAVPGPGAGATADAVIGGPLVGGIHKFVDKLPGLTAANANALGQYIVLGTPDTTTYPAGGSGYTSAPVVTFADPTGTGAAATATVLNGSVSGITITSPGAGYSANPTVVFSGGGATTAAAGKAVVAAGAITGVDLIGSDYYEIGLVEYAERMHTDLPATRMRGYVQLSTLVVPGAQVALTNPDGSAILRPDGTQALAVDSPHYLGPTIVATSNKPVRIKFYNLLPTGAGGDLFIPVDETVPGSGLGPAGPGVAGSKYAQNRAAVHLHGNNTVWISDGTPHQWITPACADPATCPGETTYPQGVSVRNVPDMDPASVDAANDGMMTLYYTNAMSARLKFYHDHAMGITRLNVYAGEAAGYVITDQVEADLIGGTNVSGVNPTNAVVLPDIGIPLVIQDRTFVDPTTIWAQDPTWNGGTGPRDPATGKITGAVLGDLWYPHIYMTVQNPWDLTGTNAFGRWHYGPWFNPPIPTCIDGLPVGCIEVGPVPNEYYQPICDGLPDVPGAVCTAPWEPPLRPGNPNPSIPGESFLDTPIVNGTAYPYLDVEPKAVRFRILNAGNDRFLNLQLYVAADKNSGTTNGAIAPAVPCDGTTGVLVENCTEVKMVPVSTAPANQYADWPSGIPDSTLKGPDWIQIGTEGGWLPAPAVIPQQPVGFNLDPAFFNFGVVNQTSLFLGTAERADVIVDFSAYAGKTLILYNDSPAPVPAGAAPYDYYTGGANLMDGGGAPTTQPGYGPNTRTIMQIRVANSTPVPYDLAALNAAFAKGDTTGCPNAPCKRGVFEATQDPIIIPQAAYNSAYNNTFTTTSPGQFFQVGDTQKTFQPISADGVLQPALTMPLEMKAMHDEMGGVYDTQFGRMSGMLGLSLPTSPVHVLIPYGYAAPPTEIHLGSVSGSQIGVFPDGTQIWRIFHNGVDTHPIHVHLFNAQLINRVGQDGQALQPPAPNEMGWKDTFRINPLEIIFIAMRPAIPRPDQIPFEVTNSVRLIDPTLPEGASLIPPSPAGWFDPVGNALPEVLNHFVNFGWEYVWHCHILSHEEMDMMHSLVAAIPPRAPSALAATVQGTAATVTWVDNSLNETSFTLQRAVDSAFTVGLTTLTFGPDVTTYVDNSVVNNRRYFYRVFASNLVGDTQVYPASIGFPTLTADSALSNAVEVVIGTPPTVPAAPSNLTAAVQAGPQVTLTFRDNANNEEGFVIERCTGAGCTNFAQVGTRGPRTNGSATISSVDATVALGTTYVYQVKAVNAGGSSLYSNAVTILVPARPAAPSNFRVAVVKANGNNYTATLTWADNATNETGFTIQRATNATFTTGLVAANAAANATSFTQTVTRNTTYYYRIRANNPGSSSAWANALPFPIRTGN